MTRSSPLTITVALGIGLAAISCARVSVPPDPVAISPEYYKVLLDSNHVRVLEYRLGPGHREPMHSHPDYVVYFFGEAKLRATYPDGHSSETVVTPGETLYRKALSHSIENIGDTEVHALLIELKRDSR
jgi:beta-alanine degradation protein BauB